MGTLWETTDYKGREVTLTTDRFEHLKRHMPEEIEEIADTIKYVIENPHLVVVSGKYGDTEVHSRYGIASGYLSDHWLHVPVLYQVGGSGDVRTAYPQATTKPGKIVYYKMKL